MYMYRRPWVCFHVIYYFILNIFFVLLTKLKHEAAAAKYKTKVVFKIIYLL